MAKNKLNSEEKRKNIILEIIMIALALLMLIPIYYMVVTTFKTSAEATANPLALPKSLSLSSYVSAWKAMNYPRVLKNNLIITGFSVLGIVIFSSMAAYPIARRPHKLNRIINVLILAGLMIPFQMTIIPMYKLVRSLGLMNKVYGVILINICVNIPFAFFLFSQFIKTIPYEIEEAAFIDGCSVFETFWHITLPLMKPTVATVAILDALTIWNDFLTPLLFLQSRKNSVILLEVYRNIGQFAVDWTNFFPMMVLGIAPLLIFYIFMQKYIIKGIASGSVKG